MAAPAQASRVDAKKKKGKGKEKEKEKEGDGDTVEVEQNNNEVASAPSLEIAGENDNQIPVLQVTTVKSLETRELSSERVVRLKTSDNFDKSIDAANIGGNAEISEKVNDTPGDGNEDEGGGTLLHGEEDEDEYEDLDDDDNGDEDESEHPGEVSIKKKLWTFFTT